MSKIKNFWFIILIIVLISTACANSAEQGGGGGLPAGESDSAQDPSDNDLNNLEGELLDFFMNVEIDNNETFQDTIKTEWVGEFSLNSEGKISGLGVVDYFATILSVDEDGCGHLWTDEGSYNFVLGGNVQQKESGNVYPVKILERNNRSSSRSAAGATCEDPSPFDDAVLDIYSETHLNGLFAGVVNYLHRVYEREIKLCQPIQESNGNASIYIEVCFSAEDID